MMPPRKPATDLRRTNTQPLEYSPLIRAVNKNRIGIGKNYELGVLWELGFGGFSDVGALFGRSSLMPCLQAQRAES